MKGSHFHARFDQIFGEHSLLVHNFLRLRIESESDVEDATVETFRRVQRGLAGFRDEGCERAWVLKIAMNVARRFNDRQLRDRTVSLDALQAWDDVPELSDPGKTELEVINRQHVECLLASLPPPQRAAVWLRVGMEYTDEETARILDVPVGTIKSWVWRSLSRLKRFCDEELSERSKESRR